MDIKQKKVFVQQKQELSKKNTEFSVFLINLNTMNKHNKVKTSYPEEEGFQCKICDKLYVSKDF